MAGGHGHKSGNYQRMAKAFRVQCSGERAGCWLCGQPIDYSAPSGDPGSFSVDHLQPVSTHPELAEVYANFKPSHLDCNQRRGNRPPALSLGSPSRDW